MVILHCRTCIEALSFSAPSEKKVKKVSVEKTDRTLKGLQADALTQRNIDQSQLIMAEIFVDDDRLEQCFRIPATLNKGDC